MSGESGPAAESVPEPAPSRTASDFLGSAYHSLQTLWLNSALRAGCLDTKTLEDLGEATIMPSALPKVVQLASGYSMPRLGLGVYRAAAGEETFNAVRGALSAGYRHIDTAQAYGNEADVGRAVRSSGLPREEVFVTTKLWMSEWGGARAAAALARSLSALDLGYVDLVLLHAPGSPAGRYEAWGVLEGAVEAGQVRSIGVSNFGVPHLEALAARARIPPAVNQIEIHPFLQRREEVAYCARKGIVVQAYSPLAKALRMDDPTLARVATRHSVTPAQVLLRWALQRGLVVLPKSVDPDRQRVNADVWNFQLSDADMRALGGLEEGLVTGWDPITEHAV